MNKKRGLILGKFAPFHVGHERLIEIALKEVDEVYVIIYDCPNLTSIPLNVRASWVRRLFPKVNVIEGWDAPNRHEDTPDVKKLQEEYVKSVLNGKKITHFFSSEYYGEHMSKALGAIDRRTNRDDPKEGYGICASMIRATMIRDGKYLNQDHLSVIVYKDILIKVAVIGSPSVERSNLVKQIAQNLNTSSSEDNLFKVLNNNSKSEVKDLNFYQIAQERYKIANTEDKIFSGKEYFIYDSTGFIDHLLSIATHNSFDEDLFRFFSEDMRSYDLVLVNSDSEISLGSKVLKINDSIFLNQITSNLNTLGISYSLLSGKFNEKLLAAEHIIKTFKKRFYKK